MKFVIVGLGSIGKRHQKNLISLGHQTIACHRDDNLKKILDQSKPDGVLICNPTSKHLPQAIVAANAGYPIFLEKPISHNLNGVNKLIQIIKQKSLVAMVGYNLRFEPELKRIKSRLISIGQVYSARIVAASYFPDWRPETDYKKNYGARKDLGGGVLLDLSHEIDYAVWLFGKVKKVSAMIQQAPELEIETEAVVDLMLEHESGTTSQIHLDYVSRDYMRNCQIIGSKGNLYWDYAKLKETGWDTNEMYVEEMKTFVKAIKTGQSPSPTIEEGKEVLEICEAARESNQTGKVVEL